MHNNDSNKNNNKLDPNTSNVDVGMKTQKFKMGVKSQSSHLTSCGSESSNSNDNKVLQIKLIVIIASRMAAFSLDDSNLNVCCWIVPIFINVAHVRQSCVLHIFCVFIFGFCLLLLCCLLLYG